jgi:hypothetical protein
VAVSRIALWPLDPRGYTPHPLHSAQRDWPEANCYVDLWIEVLHNLGLDPLAMLGFTLSLDFEGDQWTFFKPPLFDLLHLYGIEVQELNVWRGLPRHIEEQLSRGRVVITEADSYFLPDTAGLNYRLEHGKTAIAVQEIDLEGGRLGYFHNRGYHVLEGEDYRRQFHLDAEGFVAAPYVELAKLGALRRRPEAELVRESLALARAHLARRPEGNPLRPFRERLERDLGWLSREGMGVFHLYAFATLRQLGAACELASAYLRWLGGRSQAGLEPAQADFLSISAAAKALQFKLARVVRLGKPADLAPLDAMTRSWDAALGCLRSRFLD